MSAVKTQNYSDDTDRPTGGFSGGPGCAITWAASPLEDDAANPRDVLEAVIERVEFLSRSNASEHAMAALKHMRGAMSELMRWSS